MPGNPREVAEHSLDIKAGSKPVKQGLHRFDEERRRAIAEELQKLLAAGFIKEVYYPEWLANPVLIQKKSGKWRMCVDYMGLNKACPKDQFPLPHIDQVDEGHNPGPSDRRGTISALYCGHHTTGQRCPGCRARRRGTRPPTTASHVLH